MGTATKGIGSALAVMVAYLDHTFSPLVWVLLALVAVDLLLNFHQEGKQLEKMGAAFASLGFPTLIANHITLIHSPELPKLIVTLLTILYIQVVFPQLGTLVKKIKWSQNTTTNQTTIAELQVALQAANTKLDTLAKAEEDSLLQATTANGGN